jgi:hypothetical protein
LAWSVGFGKENPCKAFNNKDALKEGCRASLAALHIYLIAADGNPLRRFQKLLEFSVLEPQLLVEGVRHTELAAGANPPGTGLEELLDWSGP